MNADDRPVGPSWHDRRLSRREFNDVRLEEGVADSPCGYGGRARKFCGESIGRASGQTRARASSRDPGAMVFYGVIDAADESVIEFFATGEGGRDLHRQGQ